MWLGPGATCSALSPNLPAHSKVPPTQAILRPSQGSDPRHHVTQSPPATHRGKR